MPRSIETYKNWMKNFALLNNVVLAFTDTKEIKVMLENGRQHLSGNMTNVIIINRTDFWAFHQNGKIRDIFNSPGYPKHYPNTVNENYSCVMHAKYDALQYVIENRMYLTKYIAWVDIGYFREYSERIFKLLPPSDLRNGHIGFSQMKPFYDYLTPKDVIYGNHFWIGGGIFIGQPQYFLPFIQDYKNSVEHLLSENLMSTDQQVLYIMYLSANEYKPRLPLQLYYHICRCNYWFPLGEICRDSHDRLRRPYEKLINFHFKYIW